MCRRSVFWALLTLLMLSMLVPAFNIQPVRAAPRTIVVPYDYPTIQEAINAASTGDTIYVMAGKYYENVVVNKTVSLIGQDRSNTIVDGGRHGTIFAVTKDDVVITGFAIQNSGGFGVLMESVINCTVALNNVMNNPCGILIVTSSGNTVKENNVVNNTNGFYVWTADNNSIIGNSISNNFYGIALDEASDNVIFHNNFVGNTYQVGIFTPLQFVNTWDDGYPSGGNYWRDYNGTDLYSGPYQNITGSDGIGDTPYTITVQEIDHFPLVKFYGATFAEFNDTSYHIGGISSLKVSGTVILYDDYNLKPSAKSIVFGDTSVPKLSEYPRGSTGTWDQAVKSLEVSGNVTIYENPDYSNITITLTNNSLPYGNIGTEWNRNPNLTKSDDSWDQRLWHWGVNFLDIFHGDNNNSVRWDNDGLVEAQAQDGGGDPWKGANLEQGYERYESEVYDLGDWNDRASSLLVDGAVTLFDEVGYAGRNVTFTSDVPDLGLYGWDNVSSLQLARGSRVTLYQDINYGGSSKSFVCPSYQPPDLKVSDKKTITLEGVVSNWNTDPSGLDTLPGWTGAKFDVFAVENRSSPAGKILMLEMYFVRTGLNLMWPGRTYMFRHDNPVSYNCLVALDGFPQFAEREVFPGNVVRWKIDVKAFIQITCSYFSSLFPLVSPLDINNLSIVKTSFDLESGWLGGYVNPSINCSLSRLRLAYTSGFHDIAVSGVAASKTVVGQGCNLSTDVTVMNRGDFNETCNITMYANGTPVGTNVVFDLSNGTSKDIALVCNTACLVCGNYTISVCACPVYGENDTWNNNCTDGWMIVTIPGDVTGDFRVTMDDVMLELSAFGSTTGGSRYGSNWDIDNNGRIDMTDIMIALANFGQHYP
jgi:parallel beta-helix repeat protein